MNEPVPSGYQGINDRLHAEYVDRVWYEKLGVGTWGAVKEVLMIPVGLGELVVYVSDHVNVVVWVRGRPEGGKLLWQITGQELTAIGPGIGAAFEDWWASAQSEPDRAVGQTIGFVGSFFIPVSKLSKVTKLTSLATKALDTANKLKAAGRFEEAVVQIDRAARYAKELESVANAKTATVAGKAATEESKLGKLSRELSEAVAKSGHEIDAGGRAAAVSGKTAPVAEATSQCFTAGTPVRTDEGTKSIEAIVPGDLVLAWDSETNAVVTRPVVQTFARASDHVRVVRTRDGPSVSTTDEHPFFVQGKGFVAARLLETGDHLASSAGEDVIVAGTERRDSRVTVYNFEVLGAHTYFVGPVSVLVHNLCVGPLADADRFLQVGAPSRVHLKVDPGVAIESAAGAKIPARHIDLGPTLERIAADTAPAWKESKPLADAAKVFPDRASSALRSYPVIVDGAAAKNVTLVVDEATGASWLLENSGRKVAVTAAIRAPTPLPLAEASIPKAFFAGSPNSKLAADYANRMASAAEKGRPLFEGKALTTAEFQEAFRQMHAAAKEDGGRLIVDELALQPELGGIAARNGRFKETDAIYKYLEELGVPHAERPAIKDVASEYSPGNIRGHQYPVYAGHGQYWDSATRSLNRFNELAGKAERAASAAEKTKLQADALNELSDFTHTMANLRPTAGSTNFGVVMAITNQALVRLGRPPIYAGVVDLVALRTDSAAFRRVFVDHVMGRINLADEQKFENLLRYLDKAKRDGPEAVVSKPLPISEAAAPAAAAAKAETPGVAAGLEALRASPEALVGEKIRVLRTSGEVQDGFLVSSIERRGDRILVWASKDGTKRWQTLEDVATHNDALVAKLGDAAGPRVAVARELAAAQLVRKSVSVTRSNGAVLKVNPDLR